MYVYYVCVCVYGECDSGDRLVTASKGSVGGRRRDNAGSVGSRKPPPHQRKRKTKKKRMHSIRSVITSSRKVGKVFFSLCRFAPQNLLSRPVSRQSPTILHTQAESRK